jgi:hypothetical protein
MYPHIDEFTEHGQIVIGHIEPIGGVAIASEGRQTLAMLRRRKNEPFKQLLGRLDTAIAKATIDNVYVDEVYSFEQKVKGGAKEDHWGGVKVGQ